MGGPPDAGVAGAAVDVLRAQLAAFASGAGVLRVPQLRGQMKFVPGTHCHPTPEVFLQISGYTRFRFPDEDLRLEAGQVCVVPRGMPHGEMVGARGGPFQNLVVMLRPPGVNYHFAREGRGRRPYVDSGGSVACGQTARLLGYLDDAVEFHHAGAASAPASVRGIAMAFFGALVMAFETDARQGARRELFRVAQARQYVLCHLCDPELSVQGVARWLGCTADYLSFLYHRETGETLVQFLNEQRIDHARGLLDVSNLNVSEVALASGFSDAGYFTRVFRRLTGGTPTAFRNRRRRG